MTDHAIPDEGGGGGGRMNLLGAVCWRWREVGRRTENSRDRGARTGGKRKIKIEFPTDRIGYMST